MAILVFSKDLFHLEDEKAKHNWQRFCGDELAGKRLGIVGVGKIGREVARCAKTFDMVTLGNRRSSGGEKLPYVDQVYGPRELSKLLEQSDYLCISTPHTSETERLIGPNEIKTLPRGSVLINVSRGSIVDQSALIDALKSGHLKGAALDVFAVEPLPKESPLWDMPNVIISPHSASTVYSENGKLVQLFCDNLERFKRGEPLINTLDKVKSY